MTKKKLSKGDNTSQSVDVTENEGPPDNSSNETTVEKVLKYEEKFNIQSYRYPFNIFSEIDRELAQKVRTHIDTAISDKIRLEKFKKENPDDEFLKQVAFPNLRFVLSSYGGSVYDAMTICAAFEHAKKNGFTIEILATGTIMSAGGPILCCGSKGFRRADAYTSFLIHNIFSMSFGTLPEIQARVEFSKQLEQVYFGIMLKNSKISKSVLEKMLKSNIDVCFFSDKALQYGMIDQIV